MVKRDIKYQNVKSVVGQYIRGRTPARGAISRPHRPQACHRCSLQQTSMTTSISSTPTHGTPYSTCDECTDAGSWSSPHGRSNERHRGYRGPTYAGLQSIVAGRQPKAFIEECGPDLLCLNFSDPPRPASHQRSKLASELLELKKTSGANEERVATLFKRLDSLKLSMTLLNEEQQRLQHSKQIRAVNMRLLVNMLRSRLQNERKSRHSFQRFDAETKIVRRLFEKFATLEELKLKLEYENTRSLYAIKELKRDNAKLQEQRKELARRMQVIDGV